MTLLGNMADPERIVLGVRYDKVNYDLVPPVTVGVLSERVRASFEGDGWLHIVAAERVSWSPGNPFWYAYGFEITVVPAGAS